MKTDSNHTQTSLHGNDAAISAAIGGDAPELLSASVTFDDLDALALKFDERLKSSGGRPTDPTKTLTRQVPFTEATWRSLREKANALSEVTGYRVSASQLGGQLIEEGLDRLDRAADAAWEHRKLGERPKKE